MQTNFLLFPMSQKIELKAGEVYHGSITVAVPKDAKNEFPFKLAIYPYSVSGNDYDVDLMTMNDRSQIVNWIKLEETSGVVQPNEMHEVKFAITVPEAAPAGGQYATIGVSLNPENGGGDTIQNIYEMSALILATVDGETVHSGEIVGNSVPGFVATGAPTASITLTNTGNVHETVTSSLKVKNLFSGEELALTDDNKNTYESVIMPETTREITRSLNNLPALGVFEVSQDVSYLGQESHFATVMVICPIWFIVLVICLFVSIVGTIIFGVHLRKKKKLQLEN